ncbi:MAG TPA: hypothetical protein VIC55_04445 [Gemmatimonadaceae bacterium]
MIRVAVLSALLLGGVAPVAARAQVADSARVGPTAPVDTQPIAADSLSKPPISPKRALIQSILLPGWGQASLHRPTAGGIFVALEVTSIAMLVQSKKDLAAARALANDSVLAGAGQPGYVVNPYAGRIAPRKQAVEDWTALLIATHLFAAADAFVAAQLWDVPVEVHGQSNGQQALVSVRVPF